MLDFRILGPVEVLDGRAAPSRLAARSSAPCWRCCSSRPGASLSTDRLVDALWGEHPPRTAATSLQNFVSRLRKLARRRTARHAGRPVRARRSPRSSSTSSASSGSSSEARAAAPDEQAELLREALALWRGPPLADFAFESFAQAEIGRLEELRLAALEERIEADLEPGRHAELVGELEALVGEHPLRERLRGQLMLALYRSGRQAEALRRTRRAQALWSTSSGSSRAASCRQLHARDPAAGSALTPGRAAPRSRTASRRSCGVARRPARARARCRDVRRRLPAHGARHPGSRRGSTAPPTRRATSPGRAVRRDDEGIGPLYDELHELLRRSTSSRRRSTASSRPAAAAASAGARRTSSS